MQTTAKRLIVSAMLAACAGASFAANSLVGTWSLNLAKSTFSPGPAPKSQTLSYSESTKGLALIITTTAADCKEFTTALTSRDDGNLYPESGNPHFDRVSITRVDPLTWHSTQMKAGAVIGTGVRIVSKDGKTLTFTQKGTHANGTKYENVSVYDRQ